MKCAAGMCDILVLHWSTSASFSEYAFRHRHFPRTVTRGYQQPPVRLTSSVFRRLQKAQRTNVENRGIQQYARHTP